MKNVRKQFHWTVLPWVFLLAGTICIVGQARASTSTKKSVVRVSHSGARASYGQLAGLHSVDDPLSLRSSVALVEDESTADILFAKNTHAVLPIASITKLMTALVVLDAQLPLDEMLRVSDDDVDTEKYTRSRLRVGTELSRGDLMHLALMASENRAASALGHNYPGGIEAFVAAMNAKAAELGMLNSHFVDSSGLHSSNVSSAGDLVRLVRVASLRREIREFTTCDQYEVRINGRRQMFNNTNRLVRSASWDIGLSKTGFINEAGSCLVMQATILGRKVVIVLLDSIGKYSRLGDANRIRQWLEKSLPQKISQSKLEPSAQLASGT
ncbi:MAG: peptidase S11 [Burkholderiaceae bacterium]|nr:MAG: peptidase S11 [Burkholderiaceae bacterium]